MTQKFIIIHSSRNTQVKQTKKGDILRKKLRIVIVKGTALDDWEQKIWKKLYERYSQKSVFKYFKKG